MKNQYSRKPASSFDSGSRAILGLVAALALSLPATALAGETVGTFRFAGAEHAIRHVYLVERVDVEDRRPDKTLPATSLVIQFSTDEIPRDALGDPERSQELANESRQASRNPDDWVITMLAEFWPPNMRDFTLHVPFPKEGPIGSYDPQYQSWKILGGSKGSKFDLKGLAFQKDRVSGRARTLKPVLIPRFFDEEPTHFEFDFSFATSLSPASRAEVLTGDAARESAPVKAAAAMTGDAARNPALCMKLLLEEKIQEFRQCLPEEEREAADATVAEFEKTKAENPAGHEMMKKMILGMLNAQPKTPEEYLRNVHRVIIREDEAKIWLTPDGSMSQTVYRDNGLWGPPKGPGGRP